MFKRIIAGLTTALLAVGMVTVSAAAPAAAHNPKIEASCTTLTVNLKDYEDTVPGVPAVTQQVVDVPGQPATETTYKTVVITPADPETGTPEVTEQVVDVPGQPATETTYKTVIVTPAVPEKTNKVTVYIDGNPVLDTTFGTTHFSTHEFTPSSSAHTWRVVVDGWDGYDVDKSGTTKPCVTATPPTFTAAQCGVHDGKGSYTIPTTPGVYYKVSINDGSWSTKAAGTYYVSTGTEVEVKAYEKDGFKLTGEDEWDHKFAKANCDVTATPPTFTKAECTGPGTYGQGSYTIPTKAGVTYKVSINDGSWNTKPAGTYYVNVGTKVEVKAYEVDPYNLKGTDEWSYEFKKPNCDVDVTPNPATFKPAECTGAGTYGQGSYTIPVTVGVYYKVSINDGSWNTKPAGTYYVNVGTKVEVKAYALDDYNLEGEREWEHTFAKPTCVVDVTPKPATFENSECTGPGQSSDGTYVIPETTGVYYQVKIGSGSWTTTPAGNYTADSGDYVQVRAIALEHYKLTGDTTWKHLFKWAGLCLVKVYPTDPGFEQATCAALGDPVEASYTIPSKLGVIYSTLINGDFEYDVAPGTYPLNQGDTIRIFASGDVANGYVLAGLADKWGPYTVATIGDCLEDAPVVPPTVKEQICVPPSGIMISGYITIDDTPHVKYYIGDDVDPATPGDHLLEPGIYTVRAEADPGYKLTGYTEPWTREIIAAKPCADFPTLPDVEPFATMKQANCFAEGSFTLSNVLNDPTAVLWTVNDVENTPEGTYPAPASGVVIITAAPAPGFGFGPDTKKDWKFEFANSGDCELETLAFTGGGAVGGMLGGSLLFLGLAAVLFTRRRKEARTVS